MVTAVRAARLELAKTAPTTPAGMAVYLDYVLSESDKVEDLLFESSGGVEPDDEAKDFFVRSLARGAREIAREVVATGEQRHSTSTARQPGNPDSGDKRLAAAFRDLEPDILGLLRSAQIVELAEEHNDELVIFAIEQNLKLVEEFQRKYYEAYKG